MEFIAASGVRVTQVGSPATVWRKEQRVKDGAGGDAEGGNGQ